MKKTWILNSTLIGSMSFVVLSIFLFLHKDTLSLTPWNTSAKLELPSWGTTNRKRIALVENNLQTITVLSGEKKLLYQVQGKPYDPRSFYRAAWVELDEYNNLYVLDTTFSGAFKENVERILKYSPTGTFIGELYAYRYTNEDFIVTKGKISGMAYDKDSLYVVRLGDQGFWLERVPTHPVGEAEQIAFFDYPHAFRDFRDFHINPETRRLTTVTKTGSIRQYNFSGELIRTWSIEDSQFPWMAISDDQHNLMYTDMAKGEILFLNTIEDTSRVLAKGIHRDGSYSWLNYRYETLFAVAEDHLLIQTPQGDLGILDRYSYSSWEMFKRISLFVLWLVDMVVGLGVAMVWIRFCTHKQWTPAFTLSLLGGTGVLLGAGIATILLINHIQSQYYKNTFLNLENMSRLSAAAIDRRVLTSIHSPKDFESEAYWRLDQNMRAGFTQFQRTGIQGYQYIWMIRDGALYSIYDTEYARGTWYPYGNLGYYQEVAETGRYVHRVVSRSGGKWIFACGPIFDEEQHILGLIETGYDIQPFQEQTQRMIIQIVLMVASAAIVLFFIMLELILILGAYQTNKTERLEQRPEVFHPELLRGIIFFTFLANYLAGAILPLYSAALYRPIFNLPKELIITLPSIAEPIFAAVALLVVPGLIGRIDLKRICLMGAIVTFIGHILCFIAPNILYLGLAHALRGFSLGSILLVINTIIGSQKSLEAVNQGFAHLNASYLSGVNVGLVFGSMFAEFFPYRLLYLVSSLIAALLLAITIFSIRSNMVKHIYAVSAIKTEQQGKGENPWGLFRFLLRPVVLGTLGLLVLPLMASAGFVSYFTPIYGISQGLQESNIGQLMLLSGLFTILFGTSLCAYVSRKFPLKGSIFFFLFLNGGAIYLFSVTMSVPMLVVTIGMIAVANIFTMTNTQTYYATLFKDDIQVSPAKALSIYSMVESLGLAIGPLIFSYIAANTITRGMKLFSLSLLVCLVVFMVISSVPKTKKK